MTEGEGSGGVVGLDFLVQVDLAQVGGGTVRRGVSEDLGLRVRGLCVCREGSLHTGYRPPP